MLGPYNGLKICKKNIKFYCISLQKNYQALRALRAEFSGLSGFAQFSGLSGLGFWSYIVKGPARPTSTNKRSKKTAEVSAYVEFYRKSSINRN
jgi:hypothetical protein